MSSKLTVVVVVYVILSLLGTACNPSAPTSNTAAVTPTPAPPEAMLEIVWFANGPDQPAIEKLLAQFNAENEGVQVVLRLVPFPQLDDILRAELDSGQAPDVARITAPQLYVDDGLDIRPYLSDPAILQAFIPQPMGLMTGPDGKIFGIPHDFTLNGPFVNVSLFEEAGVSLPEDECVSWETWAELATQVRDETGVRFAMAIDRSGHRLDGFLQTYGGGYFTPEGDLRLTSPETITGLEAFIQFHDAGVFPLDVWLGAGSGYAEPDQFFTSGQLPVYIAGNWQVAPFNRIIGNQFEWQAILNGCDVQYGGMPGGKFLVAFEQTEHPEWAAQLIEFLGSKEAMAQYAQESVLLPTRLDLIEEGLTYSVQNEAMNVFITGVGLLPESAYIDNYHADFATIAASIRDEVTRVIAGELTLDEALDATAASLDD